MRTMTRRTAMLAFLLSLALPACGGGDSIATGPSDNYLPTISNFWRNVATPAHTLTLQSASDNKPSGTFTGTEAHPTFGQSTLAGSFTNSRASMVISRAAGAATYSATFYGSAKDSLRLTRGNETLVFKR